MTAPGPQDPKNAPAAPSMMEQCERQLRDYFAKLAENDDALANAYYDALSPLLLKQALGQMLGSGLDDMFGRAAAPRAYEPTRTAARAIRDLHQNVKQDRGETALPVFQSIEHIKRHADTLQLSLLQRKRAEAHAKRTEENAAEAGNGAETGTELVTKPFSTSDWVTTYFAPPPSEDAQRDLVFQSRDISEKSMKKTRRGLFGMFFGAKEEEVQEQRLRQDSVYYLAPVHKGGPIVVEGRVNISEAPAGVTIIATGDVHVGHAGAGAFIVAGGNITVDECGSRAILISARDARIDYVGTYARVYARGHGRVSNSGGSICMHTGKSSCYPSKKRQQRPSGQEAARTVKDFREVMDTIQNEPASVTALRNLFAEGIVALSAGALALEDVPVLELPPPQKALPAPKAVSVQEAFSRFAGQAVVMHATRVEIRDDVPYRMETRHELAETNLIRELKSMATQRGLSVRFNYPGVMRAMDVNDKRLNVEIKKTADGTWRIGSNFNLY